MAEPDFAQIREEVWMPEDFPQDNPDLCQICGKPVELPVCASHYDAIQADNHQLTNQLGEIARVSKWLADNNDKGARSNPRIHLADGT